MKGVLERQNTTSLRFELQNTQKDTPNATHDRDSTVHMSNIPEHISHKADVCECFQTYFMMPP